MNTIIVSYLLKDDFNMDICEPLQRTIKIKEEATKEEMMNKVVNILQSYLDFCNIGINGDSKKDYTIDDVWYYYHLKKKRGC
jgi:hypothetical protein